MSIRLFLDEDVHAQLSTILCARGFDAIHAQEAGRKGQSDVDQLRYAANAGRAIFTFNVKGFVLLHNLYVTQALDHSGIIVSKTEASGNHASEAPEILERTCTLDDD